MYISLFKKALVYIAISASLFIFNAIYTHYSFGQSSIYMQNMGLVPFIGGTVLICLYLITEYRFSFDHASKLYNSGLACIVAGMLVRGVINISGRYTTSDLLYYKAGVVFLLLSIPVALIEIRKKPTSSYSS